MPCKSARSAERGSERDGETAVRGDMARRFSWSAARGRSTEEADEDVEVVEFFSAATTSESTDLQAAQPQKKRRGDETMGIGAAAMRVEPRKSSAGDVNLMTPPTKRRRMLAQAITAMETLIEVIADEEEVLSTRLEYCSNLWRFVREMPALDVVEFVRQRSSSVVRVIEALLHTGYFPLQQLCFMTVAAILHQLHKYDTDALAAFVVSCKHYLSEPDVDLLELLPLKETIPWHDPRIARQRIVQINRRTSLCRSFRASRCWVSPSGKQDLARIRVNKWIDIGSTTTTFYWRDENDVVVVNVPHSCVEDVEIERENSILYIWTKHIDRLKGVRLLAFASTNEDFPGLVKALVGVEIDGYVDPPSSPSPIAVEFGSPIQKIKTTTGVILGKPQSQQNPTTAQDDVVVMETDNPNLLELDVAEHDSFEPIEDNSGVSEADGLELTYPGTDSIVDTLQADLSDKVVHASLRSKDSLGSLHRRLDTSRTRITETFSRVSSAQIESHDVIADKEYKLRATVDILQRKRLLDLPHAESVVEDQIFRAATATEDYVEETLDYAVENLAPDEPDFVFTTTSIIMLLIVVIPWVLFAALHSGTDLSSVRQFASDAMVLLTAMLRKIAGAASSKRQASGTLPVSARTMDLRALEEELKKLGVSIVSSRQETIISIRIKGLAGKALDRGLRLCDKLLHEKVKNVAKACTDANTKLFVDPTFGPTPGDPQGASALCKTGTTIPSKGGSQHQLKVLGLLKTEKLRWERPEYIVGEIGGVDVCERNEDDEDEQPSFSRMAQERVFSSNASLFSDGVSSGDVIQGNLGDCWFLSALSVVATRSDLLEQTFWRGDTNKTKGLSVCKFMKNYVWNYVIIDDRLPVYGFSKTKEGKPYFARCRDPDELWVSLLEKAYAKLHGSYEALIGGFIDVALNDLTGMCSEQVIMKAGYPGFGEDPFLPSKPHQQRGDPFWDKIIRYKSSGSLMGCSIQPVPTSADKNAAPESSAGNGLYFKHAYALVDAASVKTIKGEQVKLIKLRNPWGMGEWTGPWSDTSEERLQNQDVIEQYFRILKRKVGGNLSKRVFLSLNGKGEIEFDEIAQEEVIEVNANDGTFFMSYEAWMQYFTHFFAGIDFPDEWHGRRVEGCWSETNCGGNTTKSTWINNPRFGLVVQERSQFFITLSQEDPRGKDYLKIVPIGFHICSLTPVSADKDAKCEIKEPAEKDDAYYRLYKDKDRTEFKKGIRPEQLPPAIIPGSVIKGVDDDGVPQPAYTFKQAVSVDLTMEPGKYCIIPSMYMRTDKDTGKTNVGSFWISVYSNKSKFTVEGGERIVEEEEGDEDETSITAGSNSPVGPRASFVSLARMSGLNSPGKKSDTSVSIEAVSVTEQRRRFEDAKDELLAQAKAKGIGLRQLKMEFAKGGAMKKNDMRKRMLSIGFKADELSDEMINVIFNGLDESSKGSVNPDRILNMFEAEIHEDQMACEVPEVEDDDIPEKTHDEGTLTLELRGARDLAFLKIRDRNSSELQRPLVRLPAIEYSSNELKLRKRCAISVSERNPALAYMLRKVLVRKGWISSRREAKFSDPSPNDRVPSNPLATFYSLLEGEIQLLKSTATHYVGMDVATDVPSKVTLASNPILIAPIQEKASLDCSSALHKTNRMQTLEGKRKQRLDELKRKKQETLGDRSKAAVLPRLIGGRKSGSAYVQCSDCSERVLVPGRATESAVGSSKSSNPDSFVCSGSRCLNVLCSPCHKMLPAGKKVCENCYEHELAPTEAIGSHLRSILIEKIGNSKNQQTQVEAFFQSIDRDNSGALSYEEFSRALTSLEIQPPLTNDQVQSLMDQFDTNTDGEISLKEFQQWVFLDQVWQPGDVFEAGSDARRLAAEETHASVITPLVEYLIESAFRAGLSSSSLTHWVTTSNSTSLHTMKAMVRPSTELKQEVERGSLLFQRVCLIKTELSSENDSIGTLDNSIDDVFARYDTDGSGQIDADELRNMLSSLGLQLSQEESQLLVNRVELAATRDNCVDLAEFRAYAGKMMCESKAYQESNYPLVGKLVHIETIAASGDAKRDELQELAQQLHWNLRCTQAARISALLRRRVGIELSISEVQRIANVFHVREVVPTNTLHLESRNARHSNGLDQEKLLELNNSGDVLSYFLSTTSALSTLLKTFDLVTVCSDVRSHLESITKCSSVEGIWATVFGGTACDPLDQRLFLDKLVASGFTLAPESESNSLLTRLKTKVLVAIALDALREETGAAKANDEWSWSVTFRLFTVLIQRNKIDDIERRFAHVFQSYMYHCHGTQTYLVELAGEFDNLLVRAIDPVHKYRMDFTLRPHEFNRLAVAQLSSSLWPREKLNPSSRHVAFVKDPGGLVTETTHPGLNQAMLGLLARLRISVQPTVSGQHIMTPYLTLVEDDSFLVTIETMLARARLPFFWSVSPTTLEFSIDGDYLTQMRRVTFHQLITEALSTKAAAKPLHSLLKFTTSSLSVRYETVGQNAVFDLSWVDFQALLSGQQNTFAVLEIRPQGDSFATRIDRTGGNGAAKWNFKQCISLKEPEQIEHRVDSSVVYTDTVQISAVPDGSSLKRITFMPGLPGKPSSIGHFVVLSVRRAMPEKHSDNARLYCTAYDPTTSSDFAVEGCPTNWSPDFFNAATNPEYEKQWIEAVKAMYLGPVLTPKVVVRVYTKHSKIEQLVGECEVSLSSAIAHEGHVFDDWFPLLHPTDPGLTTGAINIAFHFDSKKSSVQPHDPTTVRGFANANERRAAQSAESSEFAHRRLVELQNALQQSEAARREAIEDAKRIKEERNQQLIASSQNARQNGESNEVLKWKSKLEQVRREQESQQAENEQRIAAVQAELSRLVALKREKDDEITPKVLVAIPTNLKVAALGPDASAHDIFSTMKEILISRSPDRPYNGLKKAMAAVAEVPGKISVAAFDDVLDDFGLGLSTSHRNSILDLIDPHNKARVNIEDFFIKLCGDADSNPVIPIPKALSSIVLAPRVDPPIERTPSPEPVPVGFWAPAPAPASPTRLVQSATVPAPARTQKMSWKEMRKMLLINLPEGWETRYTEKGRPYFCNHANRSTQWKHPIPEVDAKYTEWVKENGAIFQRLSNTAHPSRK